MSTKASVPQGTRDFNAAVLKKRNHIFNTIRAVFELYAFEPLETPAMENLSTLMGKYGDEGDKLIFKILNNGLNEEAKEEKVKAGFEDILAGKINTAITERALRYDLTIPFARYVAKYHNEIPMPFKRYQMQPVWRADRPQKGRYREFYQCDVDVVGSDSLIHEVELAMIYHEVFTRLGITGYELKINSRKILTALAEACNTTDKFTDITVAIDKLDKIGLDGVKEELVARGLDETQVSIIEKYLNIGGNNQQKITALNELIGKTKTGKKGIEEIMEVVNGCAGNPINLEIDFTLARGLNYYTGIIYEVKPPATVKMGSIGGGGRYDDLTGLFGLPGISGVGISFGVDRIYDVMSELNLFSEINTSKIKAIFFNMGKEESQFAYNFVQQLRKENIACELYTETAKIDKQFKYAEKKNIQYAIIIGSKEIEQKYAMVKNISTQEQQVVVMDNLVEFLKTH